MPRLALASALLVAAPAVAAAHVQLTYPLPRTTDQKDRHCGLAGSTRSQQPTVLEPGETITVTWDETIDHPGHYRISFDVDGEDFTIPLSYDDQSQSENVLVDAIPDQIGGSYAQEITLPDVECERCTLQLIQLMTDKPPYEEHLGEANDIYYQCADIALRIGGGPGPEPEGPDGGPGASEDPDGPSNALGGCSAGAGTGLGAVLSIGIALALRNRRVRRSLGERTRSLSG